LWCYAIYLKAYCLIDLRQPADAARQLDRALSMAPRNSQYLSERAELFTRARDLDASLAMFKQAEESAELTPNPNSARNLRSRACRGVGYVLVEQGKLDEAEANYNRCLGIDPEDQKSKNELGYIAQVRAKQR
jgi:tetratricopeptide (TPR) repeat protein